MKLLQRFSSLTASLGGIIGACSCTVMILASIAGLAGLLGVTVSLALPEPFNTFFNTIAQPLLILSFVLIVFGAMGSQSRLPLVLSLIGTAPTYAGMFLIPGAMALAGGHVVHVGNPLAVSVFWLGVAPLAASTILMRRRGVMPTKLTKDFALIMTKRLLASAVLVGVILSTFTFALGSLSSSQIPLDGGPGRPFTEVKTDQDNFVWRGRLTGYTKEENYFPRFSATKATITIKHMITSGELTLGIMDSSGSWVLRDKAITRGDGPAVTLTTQDGRPGTWMIVLGFRSVTGEIEVSITP